MNAFCRDPIFIWQYQSCLRKQVLFYDVYKIIHFNCRKYLCALLELAIYHLVLYRMCLTDKSGSVACCSMMILGIYTRFKVHKRRFRYWLILQCSQLFLHFLRQNLGWIRMLENLLRINFQFKICKCWKFLRIFAKCQFAP